MNFLRKNPKRLAVSLGFYLPVLFGYTAIIPVQARFSNILRGESSSSADSVLKGTLKPFLNDKALYNRLFGRKILTVDVDYDTGTGQLNLIVLHTLDEACCSDSAHVKQLAACLKNFLTKEPVFKDFRQCRVKIGRYIFSPKAAPDAVRGMMLFQYENK